MMPAALVGQPSLEVKADLIQRHYGLTTLIAGNIRRVVHYDGSWQDIRMDCCSAWGGIEIHPDGTLIGTNEKELVVLNEQGHRVNSFDHPKLAAQLTWHRLFHKLAYISSGTNGMMILEYGGLTHAFEPLTRIELGSSEMFPTTIAWASDGTAIVYSKNDEILIRRIEGNRTVRVASGTNPAWSPDGRWIAYRDKTGQIAIVSPEGVAARSPMRGVEVRRGAKWSPDGQFLLVTTSRPRSSLYRETEFVIVRMSDQAVFKIAPLIGGTTEERTFWVIKPH